MPVTLGKHGDYAVRAALDLARHYEDEPRKAREIAESMDIPLNFLKRILSELVAQGLLTSIAGPNGGYRLTQPPENITLLTRRVGFTTPGPLLGGSRLRSQMAWRCARCIRPRGGGSRSARPGSGMDACVTSGCACRRIRGGRRRVRHCHGGVDRSSRRVARPILNTRRVNAALPRL